ncbi:MAG TPA: hypothetical protein VM143_12760 [Acidimicrobiales bacterium]|nr:hypothetical protein [Acidimicrobiales bacterium]
MAGNVIVENASVSIVPGSTGTCSVRVRNTGAVVDQFSLTVLGQPAAWTTVVPAALSLFPGADGTIELHFAPPRAPGVGFGAMPFGVRVVGSEDPDNPVVEEGQVDLERFVDVTGKVTPRTSETKRKARHDLVLDNKGNAPVEVVISASDPDEQLAFDLKESAVTVAAGHTHHVPIKVAARKGFARGSDKHRPFQVLAVPDGGNPLTLDANLIQKAGLPRFVVPLIAAAVAIALIVAVLPALLDKGAKGNLQLTSDGEPVTTVAPAADDDAAGEDGPASAEESQAAAAAELAANGKDGDGAVAAGGGTVTGTAAAAGSVSGGSSGGTSTAGDGDSTNVTSPSATTAPGGTSATTTAGGSSTTTTAAGGGSATTTAAPTTTAAAKSGASAFYGSWTGRDGAALSIAPSSTVKGQISLRTEGPTMGAFSCIGSTADANDDNSFAGNSCSDGAAHQFTYNPTGDTVSVSYPAPRGVICKCIVIFTRNG